MEIFNYYAISKVFNLLFVEVIEEYFVWDVEF
jgi:hypothetical protein